MQFGGKVKALVVAETPPVACTGSESGILCPISVRAGGLANEDMQMRMPVTAMKPPTIWMILARNGCVKEMGTRAFPNSSNSGSDVALIAKPTKKRRKPT